MFLVPFAERVDSPNFTSGRNGGFRPKGIVMHYTAGYTAESAIRHLTNPNVSASAHFVIGTDGAVTQLVGLHHKAWHAGPSRYMGLHGLNTSSFGIELVNPGWLRPLDDDGDEYRDAYGNLRTAEELWEFGFEELTLASHPRVGSDEYAWPEYPAAQLDAAEELVRLLMKRQHLRFLVSHEEIDTRGWKTDPGPAFPMNRFKGLVETRRDDADIFQVTADVLNRRGGPGTDFSIIGAFRRGDRVVMKDAEGSWVFVEPLHPDVVDAEPSWVHSAYLEPTL